MNDTTDRAQNRGQVQDPPFNPILLLNTSGVTDIALKISQPQIALALDSAFKDFLLYISFSLFVSVCKTQENPSEFFNQRIKEWESSYISKLRQELNIVGKVLSQANSEINIEEIEFEHQKFLEYFKENVLEKTKKENLK